MKLPLGDIFECKDKLFWGLFKSDYGNVAHSIRLHNECENQLQFLFSIMGEKEEGTWKKSPESDQGIVLDDLALAGLIQSKLKDDVDFDSVEEVDYIPKSEKIYRDNENSIFYAPTELAFERAKNYLKLKKAWNSTDNLYRSKLCLFVPPRPSHRNKTPKAIFPSTYRYCG